MTPVLATLRSETDADGFRQTARRLLLQDVPPDGVEWKVADGASPELLFGASANADADAEAEAVAGDSPPPAGAPRVPAAFVALCRSVVLHSERQRFALLYRLLWRLQREPGLRHDALDPDRVKAGLMAQAVRRDMHKMTAFVRFREVAGGPGVAGVAGVASGAAAAGGPAGTGPRPLHVAWFEPQHHIVEATAPFFMRRFANMPWAILTPERCVRWDGETLEFGPGASRQDAPAADAGEALWLTYYQHIFNPARLKLRMMEKEMPRRYWHNLPEAALISELAAGATARSGGMLERAAVAPRRRIAAVTTGAGGGCGLAPALLPATWPCARRTARCRRRATAQPQRAGPLPRHGRCPRLAWLPVPLPPPPPRRRRWQRPQSPHPARTPRRWRRSQRFPSRCTAAATPGPPSVPPPRSAVSARSAHSPPRPCGAKARSPPR